MTRAQVPATQQKDFPTLLEASKGEIQKMLPEGMNVDRVCRVALTAFRMDPKIQKCTPMSILGSVMKACEFGLEPGGAFKHAYLVPYEDHKKGVSICTLQVSYLGFLELARRGEDFKAGDARLVYDCDAFDLHYDPRPVFWHKPAFEDGSPVRLVYAYAILSSGEMAFEVMTTNQIEEVRRVSKCGNVWEKHWGEMARKTPLKRLLKKQKLSAQLAEAIEYDNTQEPPGKARVIVEDPSISRSQQLVRELRGPEPRCPVAEAATDVDVEDVPEYEPEKED